MLKKENRITLNKDFDNVFKKGNSFYNSLFGFKVVNNNLGVFRLGILLGTKVNKKAVIRNRIKRQIREIIREEKEFLQENKDLVLIVLPDIVNKSFLEIKKELLKGLKHLKLYK